MAKLNNREAMVPWVVTFTKPHRGLGHFATTAHTTRIWATTHNLAEVAADSMVREPHDDCSWGVSGFTHTIATKPDADLTIRKSDLFTSSKRGFYQFTHVPIADFDCIDDDDLVAIGAHAPMKVKP